MTNLSCKIYFLYVVTICLYFHDYHEDKVAVPKKSKCLCTGNLPTNNSYLLFSFIAIDE